MDSHELVIPFPTALNHFRRLVTNTASFEAFDDAGVRYLECLPKKLKTQLFEAYCWNTNEITWRIFLLVSGKEFISNARINPTMVFSSSSVKIAFPCRFPSFFSDLRNADLKASESRFFSTATTLHTSRIDDSSLSTRFFCTSSTALCKSRFFGAFLIYFLDLSTFFAIIFVCDEIDQTNSIPVERGRFFIHP